MGIYWGNNNNNNNPKCGKVTKGGRELGLKIQTQWKHNIVGSTKSGCSYGKENI